LPDAFGSTERMIKANEENVGLIAAGLVSLAETSWRLEKAVPSDRRSPWSRNPGIEITGAIHRLQLPASQKDHAWTQTAAISDPMPDLRWVH
jgi:hypothetical protein